MQRSTAATLQPPCMAARSRLTSAQLQRIMVDRESTRLPHQPWRAERTMIREAAASHSSHINSQSTIYPVDPTSSQSASQCALSAVPKLCALHIALVSQQAVAAPGLCISALPRQRLNKPPEAPPTRQAPLQGPHAWHAGAGQRHRHAAVRGAAGKVFPPGRTLLLLAPPSFPRLPSGARTCC